MFRNFRGFCALFVPVSIVASIATALAVPRGFVHGSVCAANNADSLFVIEGAAGLFGEDVGVVCAIPLSTDDGIPLPLDPTFKINVEDNTDSGQFFCQSAAVNSAGEVINISTPDVSGIPFIGEDQLINSITAGASSTNSYVSDCLIPAAEADFNLIESLRVE